MRILITITAAALAALAAMPAVAQAADGHSQTFRDWHAGCLPDGRCEAMTGDRGAAETGDTLRLVIERPDAGAAGWHIALEFRQKPPRADRAVTLDVAGHGKFVLPANSGFRSYRTGERFYVTDASILRDLLPALLAGDRVRIDYFDVSAEARSFTLSLSGATASLLWIETEMDITGAPRTAVLPTDLPAAARPETDPIVDAGVSEAVWAHHQRTSDCEGYDGDRLEELGLVIQRLSETAILYALPCTAAAYNVTYRLYLREIGEIGGIRTLYFADYSAATNWTGTDLLFNISVTGDGLSAFYKGRGLGDCGSSGTWVWADYDYRLVSFRAQDECSGIPPDKWPAVFP